MSDYVPVIDGGKETQTAAAAITGGQLVFDNGSGVLPTTGATPAFAGVAAFDVAAAGARVTICRGGQQLITAAAPITEGQPLEAAAGGTVTPHTLGTNDGNIVGYAMTTTASGASVRVLMAR